MKARKLLLPNLPMLLLRKCKGMNLVSGFLWGGALKSTSAVFVSLGRIVSAQE
jgi:hypothetical protein